MPDSVALARSLVAGLDYVVTNVSVLSIELFRDRVREQRFIPKKAIGSLD